MNDDINSHIEPIRKLFKERFNVRSINIPDQPGNYRKTLRTNDDMINKLNWSSHDRLKEYVQNLT